MDEEEEEVEEEEEFFRLPPFDVGVIPIDARTKSFSSVDLLETGTFLELLVRLFFWAGNLERPCTAPLSLSRLRNDLSMLWTFAIVRILFLVDNFVAISDGPNGGDSRRQSSIFLISAGLKSAWLINGLTWVFHRS